MAKKKKVLFENAAIVPTVLRTGSPALPMGSPLRGELTWREVIGWSGFGLLLGLVAGGAGAGAVVLWLWWSR